MIPSSGPGIHTTPDPYEGKVDGEVRAIARQAMFDLDADTLNRCAYSMDRRGWRPSAEWYRLCAANVVEILAKRTRQPAPPPPGQLTIPGL